MIYISFIIKWIYIISNNSKDRFNSYLFYDCTMKDFKIISTNKILVIKKYLSNHIILTSHIICKFNLFINLSTYITILIFYSKYKLIYLTKNVQII